MQNDALNEPDTGQQYTNSTLQIWAMALKLPFNMHNELIYVRFLKISVLRRSYFVYTRCDFFKGSPALKPF